MDSRSDQIVSDAKEEKTGLSPITALKYIKSPAQVYTQNLGRSRVPSLHWERPEWNLTEIGRIYDTESYFRRACKVKKNLFLKEGYSFTSATISRAKYIELRIRQMERATKIPFPLLVSSLVDSLGRLSNAYWVKVRDYKASGGKIRITEKGKKIFPIAGYFPLPAESVEVKRDEYGRVRKFQQNIYGHEKKEFRPEDVIHFHLNKREGFFVGTPDVVPVKDDIRALRRIEENVELLVYQHLFPLFHYKVGTENAPAAVNADGSNEVEDVILKVNAMPADGCWVTSERHEITAINSGSPPIDVDKIINNFKQRIYTGLGVSAVDMGEGGTSSRSTAQTLSRNLIDDTKANQKELGAQIFLEVITELLEESTFPPASLFNEENLVYIKFNEIDLEARQSKENHLADLFVKNVISHPELRTGMGYKPFDGNGWPTGTKKAQVFSKGQGDWAQTNYGLIERDKIILQALDEPGTVASNSESKSRTKANNAKSSTNNNSVSNKNKPQNQHGTRSSAKLNKDILETESSLDEFFDLTLSNLKKTFREGIKSVDLKIWEYAIAKEDLEIEDLFKLHVSLFKDDFYKSRKRNKNRFSKDSIYTIFLNLLFNIVKDENEKAYLYGQVLANLKNGASEINFYSKDNKKNEVFLKIKTEDAIIYKKLPPIYPYVDFEIEVIKKENDERSNSF